MKHIAKQLEGLTGLLGILGGLFAAIVALNETLRKLLGIFQDWGSVQFGIASGILFLGGLLLFWNARQKHSTLIDPEAFRVNPRNKDHLVGRADDIDRLEKACLNHPLVFLVGESGSGKSALVQAGLVPRLDKESRLLPLYVDMSDLDWEIGPLHTISDTFWRQLDTHQRETLGISEPSKPGQIGEPLRRCYQLLGKIPMVIFDQFDDFQSHHRDRFLSAETGLWSSPEQVRNTNSFLNKIAELIAERALYCLFITRSDNADGLFSVQFPPGPTYYRLDRLERGFVRQLLDRLAIRDTDSRPVIDQPERGWTRLRDRLVRDLEQTAVLPQQLKVILEGLSGLKDLNVAAYERSGAISGLEASFIEKSIARAERASDISSVDILSLILELVDGNRLAKTTPKSETALASTLRRAASPEVELVRRVHEAMLELEHMDVIRQRRAPGADLPLGNSIMII